MYMSFDQPNQQSAEKLINSLSDEHATFALTSLFVQLEDLREENERLRFENIHDSFTGLLNKNAFKQKLEDIAKISLKTGEPIAVAFLDIDNLKEVNDQFGHDIGDRILEDFSEILKSSLRQSDSLDSDSSTGRLGGDEFGVLALLTQRDDSAKELTDYERFEGFKSHLNEVMEQFVLDNQEIKNLIPGFGCSVGFAFSKDISGETNAEVLLKKADHAMYLIKNSKKIKDTDHSI